ncbi:class I SAM-dependent methyltransferase [Klebsiella pneumoniae]|nr:class I SAM-dependent methyltransferase [Klebsiella pneumoniae]
MDGDWENHQLTGAAAGPRAQRRGAGASEARLSSAGQAPCPACATGPAATHARRELYHRPLRPRQQFYAYFLDDDLLCQRAVYRRPAGSDQAQWAKMARLCDQLALTPGDHLLEIGTGWGRWPSTPPAITAAGHHHHPFPGAAPLGLPSAWPAPGCRIASGAALRLRDLRGGVHRQTGVGGMV